MASKISVLLHNIRSMYNVGSIFRTADGAGVSQLYLTGYTACPPRKEISKTALGAENEVPWEFHKDPTLLIQALKKKGVKILALEKNDDSKDIRHFHSREPVCLILGNETEGVDSSLLQLADEVVHIPMRGKKSSLNVSVAFGVAAYFLTQ